jgi:hypothetical protein
MAVLVQLSIDPRVSTRLSWRFLRRYQFTRFNRYLCHAVVISLSLASIQLPTAAPY